MNVKTSNILFYIGIFLLAIGAFGMTFASFFAIIGLPIFVVGIILVLFSKKTWKQKLILIGIFVVSIISFWPIWTSYNSVGPETFLIPDKYRGRVNIIHKENCGILLKKTDEGLIYEIPNDGILLLRNEQEYGFIEHNYYLLNKSGIRTELPKMDVRDFNEKWTTEKNPNEPSRDKLGVFHWGRTGSTGITRNEKGIQTNQDEQYSYSEFYISTYSNLTEKFNFKYKRKFDSIRDIKIKECE